MSARLHHDSGQRLGATSETYLSTHGPRGEHMAAEVELARLHLVIAGAAVLRNGLDVRRTLEHLHVMHDGLITRSYHRLVLADS